MTYREKLNAEYPHLAGVDVYNNRIKCPQDYGYENAGDCSNSENCVECWNREILSKDITSSHIEQSKECLEAYNKGLEDGRNEVWELAKKIALEESNGGFNSVEIFDRFGFSDMDAIFMYYTPQEALAKLEAYEKEQEEIKVGDVVTIFPRSGGQYNAIVVLAKGEGYIDAIYSDGVTTNNVSPELYKKTGKHIDLTDLFKQIGGGE